MADYSKSTLDELIEVITTRPVGMPVRAMEQVLAQRESAIPAIKAALERWRGDEGRDLLWLIVLLGETESPDAVPVLIDQVKRTDEEEPARAACEGLAKIGAASIPRLLQMAESPESLMRIYAYAALGWSADERAYSTLLDALPRDRELGHVLAQALCDQGKREAIPPLYEAYRTCAPWQRIEFEDAIRELHFGPPVPFLWKKNWRARYRRDPTLGTFDLGWLGVSVLVWRHVEDVGKRVAPPLKSLEEILKEGAIPETSAETCEKCGAPVERPTGLPVCPENAVLAALHQAIFLLDVREEGTDDLFDLADDLDEMLWEHFEAKPSLGDNRLKRWREKGEGLEIHRQTCHWLVDQGIEDIGGGRALLLAKAAELAERLGDPQGLLSPPVRSRRQPPKAGRNDPCPCGSGLKYKRCCLGKERRRE